MGDSWHLPTVSQPLHLQLPSSLDTRGQAQAKDLGAAAHIPTWASMPEWPFLYTGASMVIFFIL